MNHTVRICGIAGSLRRASYNRGLLRAAVELAPAAGAVVEAFDLRPIPFYDADVEAEGDPEPVAALKRAILEADALLIATPENNYGIPGVLKNALDWASRAPERALHGKPVALLGATPGGFGTTRAQSHVRQVLANPGSLVLPKPELMVSQAQAKFDADGDLTDEATREQVGALLVALVDWVGLVGRRGEA
ncbi:MAG: NADPH-dependent FMN reductase [Thermoleophilia bacterium]